MERILNLCEYSVILLEFGSAGFQAEGLHYVGRLVVRGLFLEWNSS